MQRSHISMETAIKKTLNSLEENGFQANFYETKSQAIEDILTKIPKAGSLAKCGSVTCQELKLFELLKERGNEIIDPYIKGLSKEESDQEKQRARNADYLLTSTNALTETGKLVNIDGVGNRVSLQIFGPKKVFIVCGKNKITKDVHAAIKRIKEIACPQNARRLNKKTPCAQNIPCPPDGCKSNDRMCRVTVIIEKQPRMTPIEVFIINENLGY